MYRHHHWPVHRDDETAKRQTGGLVGLIVVLLLLIGGLFLVQQLRSASAVQDCFLAGRGNCDTLVTGSR